MCFVHTFIVGVALVIYHRYKSPSNSHLARQNISSSDYIATCKKMVSVKTIACFVLITGAAAFVSALPNQLSNLQGGGKSVPTNDSTRSYVVSGMITIIPYDMTEEVRNDVLHSLLFAQLAASAKHNRNTEFEHWVGDFGNILRDLNWFVTSSNYGDLAVKKDPFTIADTALELIAKNFVPAFNKTFDELKRRNTSDGCITLLVNQSYNHSTHDTTLSFASVAFDGVQPVASIVGIGLSGVKDASSMSLFHPYKKNSVKTKKGMSYQVMLDEELYAHIRKIVTDRLGDLIRTRICEIF